MGPTADRFVSCLRVERLESSSISIGSAPGRTCATAASIAKEGRNQQPGGCRESPAVGWLHGVKRLDHLPKPGMGGPTLRLKHEESTQGGMIMVEIGFGADERMLAIIVSLLRRDRRQASCYLC